MQLKLTSKSSIFVAISMLVVLLGTSAIYWEGLHGPFLLDDYINIVSTYVSEFNRDQIVFAVTHNNSGTLGRPVSVMSLLFSGIVHGPGTWGYKYHNLLIHLINGLLLFWLLLKLLRPISPSQDSERILFISGITAAIWLLHPLMVSTVLYAVQRMAQLSAMFTLTSLIIFVSLRENAELSSIKFYVLAYCIFPLSLALAILSKENGVLVPFYILFIELIIFQFNFSNRVERNRQFVFQGVFVVMPLVVGSLYTVTHLDKLINYATRNFDMFERLLTQLHVMVLYLKMILLPRLSDMSLFHDYFPVTKSFDPGTILLLLLLMLAIFLIFYLRKKAPIISFAISWFFVSHLLESTIFSLELVFEHRNYLAAVGPLFALVYYLSSIEKYPKIKYVSFIFLLSFIVLTMTRVHEWSSRESIYQMAVTDHPDSVRSNIEMAVLHYESGNFLQALQHLDIAQELNVADFGPVLHQAIYLCSTGNDLTPWLDKAEERARNYPVTVYSLNAMDNMVATLSTDNCPEISSARMLALVEAAQGQAGNQANEYYLGYLENIEGHIHLMTGNYREGMGLLLSAYERTKTVKILVNMAEILIDFERYTEAGQIINYIEQINIESYGAEKALLDPLQNQLALAKAEGQKSE